jgi:hypothetical protein
MMFLVLPATQANTPLVCNMSTVTGDDDGSFPMTLPFSLQLGNTNYNQIYYSTNGLMSFGQPDGNFWSYPSTPSVTLAGRDWVSFGPGAYTSYGYNENSFCIEWSVRPFPQSSGDLTQIRLVVNRFDNGGWHGEITTLGWIPPDIRRGIVWEQNGTPLPIEAAFDVNGGVPVEVEPAPAPTSFTEPPAIPTQCWDGSTVYSPATCPTEPAPTQCWDGSSVTWRDTCPPTPPDIVCWNGEVISWNETCPQMPPMVECWDGSEVNWDQQCPTQPPIITYPDNATYITVDENGQINYVAPTGMKINQILFASYGTPNNYQYSYCHAINSLSLVQSAINNNELIINAINDVFGDPCGGTGKRLSVVLTIEIDPTYVTPSPTASPEPQPSESQTPTEEPSPQPSEPSPQPSETSVQPSETPSPSPAPSDVVPSESPLPPVEPEPTQDPTPEPETSSPESLAPIPDESPTPDPDLPSIDLPSDNNITEITDGGTISDAETEQLIDNFLNDGFISEDEVSGLSESLTEDGVLTEDEKELLVDVILEQADGNAISTELIDELGLDYEDLPDDQPVALENGVILFAEVADALEIFENPSEILGAVFTDPGKALTAVANIGADMTPEKREESQRVVVASVIGVQVIAATNLATGRIR